MTDQIITQIVVTGEKEAIASIERVGAAGEQVMSQLQGQQLDFGFSPDATKKVTGFAAAMKSAFGSISSVVNSFAAKVSDVANGVDSVSTSMNEGSKAGVAYGRVLSGIGKATGVSELGQLGRIISVVGRAALVAAPAIAGIGLERIAASATEAVSGLADLAAQLGSTTSAISSLQNLGAATGVAPDKMTSSLKSLDGVIKQTADSNKTAAAQQDQFNTQLDAGAKAAQDAADKLVELRKKQSDLSTANLRAINDETSSLSDLQKERERLLATPLVEPNLTGQAKADADLHKAQQQRADDLDKLAAKETKLMQDQLDAQTKRAQEAANVQKEIKAQIAAEDELLKKNQDIERQRQQASVDLIKNGTVLQKLGIDALDAAGKLKKSPEVILQIADAMKAMGAGADRTQLDFDLVAAGIDRKLLPALHQGAAGFQALQDSSGKIAPPFTDADVKVADDFAIATQGATDAWKSLVNEMGIAIAPSFVPLFNTLRDLFVQIKPAAVAFGEVLAQVLGPMLNGIAIAIKDVLIPALSLLYKGIGLITDAFNAFLGTDFTPLQFLTGILVTLGVLFGGWLVVIPTIIALIGMFVQKLQDMGVTWVAVKQAATDAWTAITQATTDAIQALTDGWNGWVQFFTDMWTQIGAAPSDAWDAIMQLAMDGIAVLEGLWDGFKEYVTGIWDSLVQAASDAWDQIKKFAGFGGGGAGAGGDGGGAQTQGLAAGGLVRGPGTSTSDSVLLWGSRGEYMQPERAVQKYGLSFMEAIRSLRFDPSRIRGFAAGGLIDGLSTALNSTLPRMQLPQPAVASIGSSRILNLSIGGESFDGLRGDDATMDRLSHFAVRQQLRSQGRKPNWHR